MSSRQNHNEYLYLDRAEVTSAVSREPSHRSVKRRIARAAFSLRLRLNNSSCSGIELSRRSFTVRRVGPPSDINNATTPSCVPTVRCKPHGIRESDPPDTWLSDVAYSQRAGSFPEFMIISGLHGSNVGEVYRRTRIVVTGVRASQVNAVKMHNCYNQ